MLQTLINRATSCRAVFLETSRNWSVAVRSFHQASDSLDSTSNHQLYYKKADNDTAGKYFVWLLYTGELKLENAGTYVQFFNSSTYKIIIPTETETIVMYLTGSFVDTEATPT